MAGSVGASGFRGLGVRGLGLGFRVSDLRLRVQGLGFTVVSLNTAQASLWFIDI